MKMAQMFPSKYLKKDDVTPPKVLTIQDVTRETMQNNGEEESVLHFQERGTKSMVLNNVNGQTIAGAYGDESDAWTGCKVEVYYDPNVMFGKDKTGGIRLRIPEQTRPASAPTSTSIGEELLSIQTAAWKSYLAKFMIDFPSTDPIADKPVIAAAWKRSLATFFPGKSIPSQLGISDWKNFVDNNFARPSVENPIGDAPVFDDASIPF